MAVELFTNQATTTVTSGGTTAPSSGTSESWTVISSSSFPAASNSATPPSQFHVADPATTVTATEIIAVTNVSGTTWTVTRGAESTTPVAHTTGFTVQQVISAASLNAFAQIPGASLTGPLAAKVVALSFGATIAVNAALGNVFAVTLTSSAGTLANPSNPVDGQAIRVRVTQDATGSRTLAYGTAYDFGGAGTPTLSTGSSKVDILGFEYVAALSKWCYLGSGLGF